MLISLPNSLLALILIDVASGFQGHLHRNQHPSVVGGLRPLLTMNSASESETSRTALFGRSPIGMEGDPLEDGTSRRNPQKRLVPHQKNDSGSSPMKAGDVLQQVSKPKLVRPSSNDNERKATISSTAGVNMELKDPKERVFVRHATASSAYGVDDFKGKKKKIIKPWSSGRKKNKNKLNNTGGIAREAYGEELEVELKNEQKRKRLVMARTNSLSGSQDAAKALISGGSKAGPLTATDIAEERRSRKRRRDGNYDEDDYEDDYEDDAFEENDSEPSLVRLPSSIERGPEDDSKDGPNLVRLKSSIVRQPESGNSDEPNLVRLSSSIVREPEDDGKKEPNLVRLDSSIVREPEKDVEEELKFYTRSDTSDEQANKEGEQRLVRAVPASQPPSSDEPKLVRPNLVKAEAEGPKLTRANVVTAKAQGPKLVRPNVFRAKAKGPKLVRANVQKAKPSGPSLVRPKAIPDGMDVGNQALDFMYGANAATNSPTAVTFANKSEKSGKPTVSGERSVMTPENSENFMYGSNGSTFSPTSVTINSKPKKGIEALTSVDNTAMEKLMYGANQAATSPTAVSFEYSKVGESVRSPMSIDDNPMDDLMYGAQKATASPTAVPITMKSKKKVVRVEGENSEGSEYDSDDLIQDGTSESSVPVQRISIFPSNSASQAENAMDELMYGHQRATSSPTAVKIEPIPTKYVKLETRSNEDKARVSTTKTNTAPSRESETNSDDNDQVEPKRKRFVKPSTSSMDRVVDWDAANPTSTTTNPTSVRFVSASNKSTEVVKERKKKKYVQPSTSLMDNAPDWDAVQPATTTSNPSVVNIGMPKSKKQVENTSEEPKMSDPMVEKQTRKYVQPSTSQMDNAPDWDAVQPAMTTSNPSVVNVDIPESKKQAEFASKEAEKSEPTERPKKIYVQPSTSLMDNEPDWNAVQPATTTSNPSVVSVDVPESKKQVEFTSNEAEKIDPAEKGKKRYVQPSTSMMDNVPDWDAVKSATTTSNPSVVSVDVTESKKQVEVASNEVEKTNSAEKGKKKYVQPSTSMMDNVADWDAAQPVSKTSNPTVINVDVKREGKGDDNFGSEKPKKKKYVQPSRSLMDSAPDWDAVQPAIATSNPSVVNVDGINKVGQGKRLVRPFSSGTEGETDEQFQSTQKENPANANPIGVEDSETELPAAIAHATDSSSDGWTPEAHFPSDDKPSSPNGKESRTRYYSAMENYSPDALPRPTGVIPLTVSSSTKDKTQLFRAEHSLEPDEDVSEVRPNGGPKLKETTVSPFTRNVSRREDVDETLGTGKVNECNKDKNEIDDESIDV